MKVVLASGNKGKLSEFGSLLAPYNLDLVAQKDLGVESPEETGLTFIENAILKARYASKVTGLPALSDDSGLAVEALGGAPGIYSARFAGEEASDADNIDKLLAELKDLPEAKRAAAFHCVLVYMRHAGDPTPIVCHGTWHGRILDAKSGEQGFGYDPIFWSPEFACSAAELSKEQKNQVSHRGKALESFKAYLQGLN